MFFLGSLIGNLNMFFLGSLIGNLNMFFLGSLIGNLNTIIPGYFLAALWGIIGSIAILIGSFFGYKFNIPKKILAAATAFSSGLLISAVCFEILFEAYHYGHIYPTVVGFLIGVIVFTVMDAIIHRFRIKKCEEDIKSDGSAKEECVDEDINPDKYDYTKQRPAKSFNKYQVQGYVTIVGAVLDAIPEAIAIGLIFFIGGPISISLLIAVIIANSFEGVSASTSMRLGGWKKRSIFGVWVLVIILSAIAAMASYIIFSATDTHILSGALAMASGALLAMIADTMLPEAYDEMHEWTGLIMALGFLLSFVLSHSNI